MIEHPRCHLRNAKNEEIKRSQAENPQMALKCINPLNAYLNPICHLPALLGDHHILRVSCIRFNLIKD